LLVGLTDAIKISTWNNSVSDIVSKTLIAPDSKLYDSLASLKEGDQVKFSGHFVAEKANCLEEQSLVDRNGMTTPTFTFRFTSFEKE